MKTKKNILLAFKNSNNKSNKTTNKTKAFMNASTE